MALQGSGQMKMSDIYNEFTGTHDGSQEIQMTDYRGDGDVPSSGEIQLAADMYGASDVQATPYTGYQMTYGGYTTNIKWGVTQNGYTGGTLQYSNSWGSGRGAITYKFRLVQTSGSGVENYKLTGVAYGRGANYSSPGTQYSNVGYAARICTGDSVAYSDAVYNVTGTRNFGYTGPASNASYEWFWLPSPGGTLGTVPTLDIGTWYTFSFRLTSGTQAYGNWWTAYAWCDSGTTVTLSNNSQIQLQYATTGASAESSGAFDYLSVGGFSPASYGSCSNPWMGMNMAFSYPYAVTSPNQG